MTERTRPIQPGDKFNVTFAEGTRTAEVVALSNAKQKVVAGMLRTCIEAEKAGDSVAILKTFDITEQMIEIVCPYADHDWLETISGQNILEIAGACMSQQEVDAEEMGKSD